jgi:hypothetical protein
MKSKGNAAGFWKVLRLVGLCGSLAFVISVASPSDDEIQQECLAGRTRHHSVRLLKTTIPAATLRYNISISALAVAFSLQRTQRIDRDFTTNSLPTRSAILAHKTGDRSPPVFAS